MGTISRREWFSISIYINEFYVVDFGCGERLGIIINLEIKERIMRWD